MEQGKTLQESQISRLELETLFKKNKNTALGEDRLAWPILKRAFKVIPQIFLRVNSALFSSGFYPEI